MICSTAGDLGDICYAMCVLNAQVGGPHTLLLKDNGQTCGIERRESIIAPLAKSQTYIKDCRIARPDDKIEWHSADFRMGGYHTHSTTLVQSHAHHGMSMKAVKRLVSGNEKWLLIKGTSEALGRVVIGRTHRWRNSFFPWKIVVETYGPRLMFLGTEEEHHDFCAEFGPVYFRPTKDLLEAAQLIASSWLFISNQTSLWAIAEGLKVRRIQETCLVQTDCIYLGGDVQHCADGEVKLPLNEGEIHIRPAGQKFELKTMQVPPGGGWHFEGKVVSTVWSGAVATVRQKLKCDETEALRVLIEENVARVPHYFSDRSREHMLTNYRAAMENAKHSA